VVLSSSVIYKYSGGMGVGVSLHPGYSVLGDSMIREEKEEHPCALKSRPLVLVRVVHLFRETLWDWTSPRWLDYPERVGRSLVEWENSAQYPEKVGKVRKGHVIILVCPSAVFQCLSQR
jgi:hypothetical protein